MDSAEAAVLIAALDAEEDEAIRRLKDFTDRELHDLRTACLFVRDLIEDEQGRRAKEKRATMTTEERIHNLLRGSDS